MTKSPLKLVAPATVNRTVTMPRRKPNSVYRTREHLTGAEVDRLIDAAKANRWGFPAHPHMLRHACGFALANKGHDT